MTDVDDPKEDVLDRVLWTEDTLLATLREIFNSVVIDSTLYFEVDNAAMDVIKGKIMVRARMFKRLQEPAVLLFHVGKKLAEAGIEHHMVEQDHSQALFSFAAPRWKSI